MNGERTTRPLLRAVHRTRREEMETTATWNRHVDPPVVELCTSDPAEARRWARRGYDVRPLGYYPGPDREPRTWETTIPVSCLTLRRLVPGARRGAGVPVLGQQPTPRVASLPASAVENLGGPRADTPGPEQGGKPS